MIMRFAKRALGFPSLYDSYQTLVGSPGAHQRIISDIVRPAPGERILDIGCGGVGAITPFIPSDVDYVGIDISPAYIAKAQKTYSDRTFICTDISSANAQTLGPFDRAVAFGVLHHIPDEVAENMAAFVRRAVKPGGYFFTIDPCYVPGQSLIAKTLIDNDRGQFVRDAEGYRRLIEGLGAVHAHVHHDLLRIPYTQVVMEVMLESGNANSQ